MTPSASRDRARTGRLRVLDSRAGADAADFAAYEIAPDRARNARCPGCGAPAERTTVDLAGAGLRQTTVRCLADGPRCRVRVEHEPIPLAPTPAPAREEIPMPEIAPVHAAEDIPICPCGCGRPVARSRHSRRNGALCKYAEKSCADAMRYRSRQARQTAEPPPAPPPQQATSARAQAVAYLLKLSPEGRQALLDLVAAEELCAALGVA